MNIPLRRYWDLLAEHIQPQKGRFILLTVLLLSSIGLQIVNPQIMRYFIDTATTGGASEQLALAALAFIGLALFQQIIGVSATYLGENVAWTATNALRADMARHCLNLDMSFHNNRSPGELIERIDGDVQELSNFFSQLVIRVVGNIILLLGVLVVLFLQDWRVGLAFTVFSVVALFTLNRVRGIAVPYQKALRAAIADLTGFLEERLAGTEDIRSSGAVDFVMNGLYQLQHRILGHQRKAWTMNLAVGFTGSSLLLVGNIIALVAGFFLYQGGLLTIGAVYLLVYYINLLARPIRELTQQTESLQNIGAATERLANLLHIEAKTVDGAGSDIPAGPLSLVFDEVIFGYVENEPVLKNISFELEPGKVMGLLGRTGSGKTTLARLVFRLYDPSVGRVVLGGVDVRRFKLRQLRQSVALVTQDVQLFQASVRDNLTFFNRSIPDERVLAVIEDLELSDWYRQLPNGLDTRLETGGRSLSAGEGQLLALARVFLRNPGLVILDEASSRLDPATEQRIERAVDKLLRNRTALIIAHRLGTVQRADNIMILEDGCVVEAGQREWLMHDSGSRFSSLLRTGLEEVLV
ncbi:MAG: ABC transporter ATP-binding protein/permease [Chloroflexi bacterium]|nr:ABC transporter ATP-binding protein/permease [Chloroflexota bacterium]